MDSHHSVHFPGVLPGVLPLLYFQELSRQMIEAES